MPHAWFFSLACHGSPVFCGVISILSSRETLLPLHESIVRRCLGSKHGESTGHSDRHTVFSKILVVRHGRSLALLVVRHGRSLALIAICTSDRYDVC